MRYTATIHHHSLSRAHEITVNGTLTHAKRRAIEEFGDGFVDHTIVIYELLEGREPAKVAERRIGDSRWRDYTAEPPTDQSPEWIRRTAP